MSAEIIPFIRQEAIEAAWETYSDHVAESIDNRSLLTDRQYMEKWASLEREWKRLFWAGEGR